MTVDAIAAELAAHPSILGKLDIAGATRALGLSGNSTGRPGDDAAALPRPEGGWDLFAAEAFIPAFVADDPWFAGWCGVMVNLSDIAAMGGQATAITDMIWAPDAASAAPVLEGLFAASKAYGVPIVGGHTNLRAPSLNLSVAVTGRARALISSFAARPDDMLIAVVDLRGAWRPRFDNWFAATDAPASRLRGDLALLPELAESGLVRAGKDISQGGIAGTSLMLGECSGCGFEIDLDRLPMPPGVDMARWMRAFPSFGFLLSVHLSDAKEVCARFADRALEAAVIGRATAGSAIDLVQGDARATFWDWQQRPYLALGPGQPVREVHHA
ncbi:sll0787 family AIR synthase-like protein [Pseudotabrizicola alkalilacus]|uniref:Sll0787 family AIR synthase-like protein n=1 Tax=Pseudotabrizicola alkalilacus TaxID=2305252 RepID=A0A411Z4N0_9RHOB|nr:sll0787 family AIR synthase-like protein [Pseudotabrizicola alkalilacus]RGP38036.1 sll0787 family AIR synthase-like protein [Pseudotabrizicola alkalilacus]